MSVFRDPLQMVDSFTKHVQEQDYELNEKLNARLILPNDLSQIKNTVVSHLKTILKSANSMNPKAFGRLAREVSNTNLKDYSTAHLDASNNSTKIKSRNLSISTKLVRNPIYSSHFLNEDGLIHIYINGELMTFDLDKYKKIGLFIKGDAPFSGEDVLEEKTQKNDSDWDQLKVYFRELMTKGYLIAA